MNTGDCMTRLLAALEAGQKPSYDLLEENVHALLQERQGMLNTVTDMATKFSKVVFARMTGDTEQALALLDDVIAHNVTITTSPAPVAPH